MNMAGLTTSASNGIQEHQDHISAQEMSGLSLSSQAIHADDFLLVNQDVAPALHVSTTFRYSGNPDALVPHFKVDVRKSLLLGQATCH
jgi:hypothetical protein